MKKWNHYNNLRQNKSLTPEAVPVPEDCPDWKIGVTKLHPEEQPRKKITKKQPRPKSERRPIKPDLNGRNYAAIDLGTNSCRLVIASPTPSSFRIVETFSKVTQFD
jgi:hypothetical protein